MTEKRLAKIISILFHPFLMTTLGVLILLNSGTSLSVVQVEIKRITLVIAFLFSAVFPGAMILILYLTKMIRDIDLSGREERTLPIMLTLILVLFAYFVMRGIPHLADGHVGYMLSPAVGLFILLGLNRWLKPSLHMAGLGGLVGMLLVLVIFYGAQAQYLFSGLILVSGLTASARIRLGLQSLLGVSLGFFTGFLATIACMVIHLI